MASAFTHAFVVLPLGKTFFPGRTPARFWALALLCALLPDADVLGFYFRMGYGTLWWHRGFTHSLFFAFCLSSGVMFLGFRKISPFSPPWWRMWGFFFLLTCLHGILDAMTTGGYGVAFFAPFDPTRYSLPWTPLKISPLRLSAFFSPRGKEVIWSEIVWVWAPSLLLWAAAGLVRVRNGRALPRLAEGARE